MDSSARLNIVSWLSKSGQIFFDLLGLLRGEEGGNSHRQAWDQHVCLLIY